MSEVAAHGIAAGPHLDDAQTADLVLGLLAPEARAAALAHAGGCAACEARLRAHAGAHERALADLATLAPLRADGAAPVVALPLWRRPAFALAAAAALVIALGGPLLRARFAPHVAAPELPVPSADVVTRAGTALDPHLQAGLDAYRAHDLARAERELAQAHASGGAEAMRRIYLAQLDLDRGEGRDALELLRGVDLAHVPEPWRRATVALLARAYRASGQGGPADSLEHALGSGDPTRPVLP